MKPQTGQSRSDRNQFEAKHMRFSSGQHVSILTRHPSGEYFDNTGDIDYAEAVHAALQPLLNRQDRVQILKGHTSSEEEVYERVRAAKKPGEKTVLHLMLNSETGTGYGHSPEKLMAFKKEMHAELVLTSVEFDMYGPHDDCKHRGKGFDQKAMEYFPLADRFIFLDEPDKCAAIEAFQHSPRFDRATMQKLEQATIAPVPSTKKLTDTPFNERISKDVCFFGMIRSGKGLDDVVELARLMQSSRSARRIQVVGNARAATDQPDGTPLAETELGKLMLAVYPQCMAALKACDRYEAMVTLLGDLQTAHTPTALPIDLHINRSPEALPGIFSNCGYAIVLDYHGGGVRNTGKSTFLANDFIIFTHQKRITPNFLCEGGEHHGAMIFLDPKRPTAPQIAEELARREKDPSLDAHTISKVHGVKTKVIHPRLIGNIHLSTYNIQPARNTAMLHD